MRKPCFLQIQVWTVGTTESDQRCAKNVPRAAASVSPITGIPQRDRREDKSGRTGCQEKKDENELPPHLGRGRCGGREGARPQKCMLIVRLGVRIGLSLAYLVR